MGGFVKNKLFCGFRGIFVLLFFILGVWIVVTRGPVQAQPRCDNPLPDGACPNGSGFLWTDTYGWISLNCVNDWDDNSATPETEECGGEGGRYGVFIGVNAVGRGSIVGYGWSPTLGLVCFGVTCGECSGIACRGGSLGTVETIFDIRRLEERTLPDGTVRLIAFTEGFARVEAHRNEGGENLGGWIQLDGEVAPRVPIEVGLVFPGGARRAQPTLAGSAWQRNLNGSGVGWIYFGDPPPGSAPIGTGSASSGDDIDLPPTRETDCSEGPCCANGIDDDLDESYTTTDARDSVGTTGADCTDYDCVGSGFCLTRENRNIADEAALAQCFDGVDNDLDAFLRASDGRLARSTVAGTGIDCADENCASALNPADGRRCVRAEAIADEFNYCHDGIDNDGDEGVDCADRDDCGTFVTCVPENLRRDHPRCTDLRRCSADCLDADGDNVCDSADNCAPPSGVVDTSPWSNPDQANVNANAFGDVCDAWLETQGGAIYAHGFRAPRAPAPSATLCLLASGELVNYAVQSTQCARSTLQLLQGFRLQQYPDTLALWSEALRGRIDFARLRSNAESLPSSLGDLGNADQSGKVFYHRGNLEVNDPITWQNASGNGSGARTVLVEGNITFNASSGYSASAGATNSRNLASVAWIAVDPNPGDDVDEGNITIGSSVGSATPGDAADLVGAFLASGAISTGRDPKALTVHGLMVARRFAFERQYADQTRGAELIIYDGRALLNPPPGLGDIVKSLPTFRSVASP